LLNRETATATKAPDFDGTELNASIKGDFLITKKKIYLNNGSTGPVPVSTIKSITDFYLRYSEQGPDSNEFNDYLDNLKKETRKRVADLINCSNDEVIFTQSTTEGINFIANGLTWNKGNRILLRNQINEHPSNYLPWVKVARDKNLKIDKFPHNNGKGNTILDDLKETLGSNDHRIVSTSHVMYNDGSITPVEVIGKIIENKNRKTLLSIDGAQSVGAVDVDVKKMNCDFLSFPAFKWICGPLGIGILYVNKEVMDEIEPVFVGAGSAKIESGGENKKTQSPKIEEELKYYKYPEKYHPTFRNFPGLAGLESSLRYLLRIGMHNVIQKNKKTSNVFRDEITKIRDIVIHEASEEHLRSSMICFSFKRNNNSTVRMLVEKLQERGIILAEREIGLKKIARASPHFYNTEEEMIKTADEMKSILNKM
jgi:cysteine desulfurase/selenocysteine lyase